MTSMGFRATRTLCGSRSKAQAQNVQTLALARLACINAATSLTSASVLIYGGSTNPDRAFTADISDALIAPVAFTSN